MSIIAWTDHFATGLSLVDRQHRRLVVLINRLGEALATSTRPDDQALVSAFERLRDHAVSHFSDEERLMLNAGIDRRHCEAHAQAHAQLLEMIDSLWCSPATTPNPGQALLELLSPWFVQHTLGLDMSMAVQIKLLRQGESAVRCYELACAADGSESKATLSALRHLFQTVSQRNLALEQRMREHTQELELANLALQAAQHRLNHQDGNLGSQTRARTEQLERENRALVALNRRLEDIARTDGLLGIANRASFDERYRAEWLRGRRDNLPLSLLMIDVDHFKHFNDTYGHPAGDRCLQKIAQSVTALVQRPGDFVARYGGEELVVLLPNTDLEGARLCGEQICRRIRSLEIAHATSEAAACVTVSIGASCGLPGYTTVSAGDLLSQADQALYRAKSEGRNRVCCCRNEVVRTLHDQLTRCVRPFISPRLPAPCASEPIMPLFPRSNDCFSAKSKSDVDTINSDEMGAAERLRPRVRKATLRRHAEGDLR